ncbi:hypothetical protein E3O19_01405 [Cryobacterium algoritolerans]|uniref:Uncharacterized protein n=1 Tax=Cryobacterium algoritolerans TaxID=1259184 RepID=A0A4R8WX73_9MICO|nr:hypothetical protein [Cryobacterium algoritolerans]TFC20055.1 hypothetical protein E3O19_01405 [Cryobacterium algoritolerans]
MAVEYTDADVRAADVEAAEAQALVASLEEAVMSGDESVTHEQITAQESLGRFAKLRAEFTRKKAAQATEARRQEQLTKIRTEMEECAGDSGERFGALLLDVENAVTTFVEAVQTRNDDIADWRKRMIDLGVPAKTSANIVPPAEHGRLSYNPQTSVGDIQAGEREMSLVASGGYIQRVLMKVLEKPGFKREQIFTQTTALSAGALYEDLAAIDTSEAISREGHFYRGAGGSIIHVDKPYTAEEIKRHGMQKLTLAQVFG